MQPVTGFSKLSKSQKIDWLVSNHLNDDATAKQTLTQYWNEDQKLQDLHDGFSENTVTNYYFPFGLAPNFLIDGDLITIPMAIEESSVVAAASKAAKFWLDRGGFKTQIKGTKKVGQVHLMYHGLSSEMDAFYAFAKAELLQSLEQINASMKKRGGGIQSLELVNKTKSLDGYYQLHATFETKDAMGANFINTTLEQLANTLRLKASEFKGFSSDAPEVIMSILSNYVPECVVNVSVSCKIDEIGTINGVTGAEFATKFVRAVDIATVEPFRAVTHNKGIMNGIDAVVIATGNDFRAVEAGVHAYASRDGQYRSLTRARIENDTFIFEADFPLALGTVGGLTSLHPLSKLALQILDNPNAEDLMKITAVAGLAQNFAALHSLVTTGIQAGHMKMHLANMLEQIGANDTEKESLRKEYSDKTPSFSSLRESLDLLRK
ncbi:3-hydroxy-3-methylglutaryl-coenzyme A reductase [Nonlabens dokdonensis]|uniref:3-hydroxy-3-methylglutaryl coenzyme A reductase n=2 Tax=Nonlabens dokdonensis TaxID=328515 RepID=L7WAC3_NONDD|nr:hydroxymethylglutaryl-CoA reductase, degradative [Nonlabens dokdonensis]AGC77167.1 3-hydroxy-3-methylglutaryl-coenzyme A reductase [Nonlabens dokdonensis DSW-6]PZX41125.1 3-hydroxy-3-methylglutaryl-coenzyme A reductase [Nonlabens dokdonensis]